MATIEGTSNNDYLTGTEAADSFYGGDGDDTLVGGGGNDRIYGGAGADVLHGGGDVTRGGGNGILRGGSGDDVLSLSSPPGYRVDGGAGTDRLKVLRWDLDLTAISNDKVKNIEIIDLDAYSPSGTQFPHTLTLKKADLLDISSTSNTLKILGGDADTVDIVGRFKDLGVSGDFHRYKLGTGILLVDTDIIDVK